MSLEVVVLHWQQCWHNGTQPANSLAVLRRKAEARAASTFGRTPRLRAQERQGSLWWPPRQTKAADRNSALSRCNGAQALKLPRASTRILANTRIKSRVPGKEQQNPSCSSRPSSI